MRKHTLSETRGSDAAGRCNENGGSYMKRILSTAASSGQQKNKFKQMIAAVLFLIVASLGLAIPAHAGVISANVSQYDSLDGYDYATIFPPATYQYIGT